MPFIIWLRNTGLSFARNYIKVYNLSHWLISSGIVKRAVLLAALIMSIFDFISILTLSHIQQTCRRLWKHTRKKLETPIKLKYNNWIELKTWWQKEKLLVLSHVFAMFSKSFLLQRRQKAPLWGKCLIHIHSLECRLQNYKSLLCAQLSDWPVANSFSKVSNRSSHLEIGIQKLSTKNVFRVLKFLIISYAQYPMSRQTLKNF